MSILTRLTAGAQMKDPREGRGTGASATTLAEIGLAAGTLDWFAHDLLLEQHCQQTPANLSKTLDHVGTLFMRQWQAGKGPQSITRKRLSKISRAIWQDFSTNQRMTDLERATLCGMTDRHWRRGTNEAYRATIAEINTLATKAYRDVKYQLSADI